jgi:hypothetical protein
VGVGVLGLILPTLLDMMVALVVWLWVGLKMVVLEMILV